MPEVSRRVLRLVLRVSKFIPQDGSGYIDRVNNSFICEYNSLIIVGYATGSRGASNYKHFKFDLISLGCVSLGLLQLEPHVFMYYCIALYSIGVLEIECRLSPA